MDNLTASTPKCLMAISKAYGNLSSKKRAIADYVVENPEKTLRGSITRMAKDCGCNPSTIVRFCREVGYKGFPEMKIDLASDLSGPLKQFNGRIRKEDGFSKIKSELLGIYFSSLNETFSKLDEEDVRKAASLIMKAQRIALSGVGASGAIASEAQAKFMRIGRLASYHADPHYQKIASSLLDQRDVLVAISFSGETRDVLSSVEIARAKGVPVLAITGNGNSKLAELADVKLISVSFEDKFRLTAMSSRIAQSAIIDLLVLSMTLQDYGRVKEDFDKTQAVIIKGNGD